MSSAEAQDLKELHQRAERILKDVQINIHEKRKAVDSGDLFRCNIVLNRIEKLEYMYDDLVCKIADVSVTVRKIKVA